jgi:hypothetical protein
MTLSPISPTRALISKVDWLNNQGKIPTGTFASNCSNQLLLLKKLIAKERLVMLIIGASALAKVFKKRNSKLRKKVRKNHASVLQYLVDTAIRKNSLPVSLTAEVTRKPPKKV